LAQSPLQLNRIANRVNSDNRFAIILCLVLLAAYQPTWHGTLILDDAMRIPKPADRSVSGLVNVWIHPSADHQYHPLVDTAFWIETKIFKDRMIGYHLLNILLHATAASLLFKILRELSIPGAWLAAGLFALHPVQVESVAWLAEMKNTLAGVYLFAALLAYLRYDRKPSLPTYVLTWLFFVLGLLAKGTAAYLPVVVLIIRWWQRGKLEWRRDVRPLAPFFVVGAIATYATIFFERQADATTGALVIPTLDRVLIAGRAFWFYLGKLFWPASLNMFYPRWTIDAGAWGQYLFPVTAIVLLLGAWRLRHRYRWLWAGLIFFVLMLAPFLGFINVRFFRFQFVSDHFEYLAILGVAVPLAAGVSIAAQRWPDWRQLSLRGLVGMVLALLTIQTWLHSAVFRSAEDCYRDSIADSGGNWIAHANLAIILIGRGQPNEAESEFRQALQLNPPETISIAGIHLNLGQVLRLERQPTEAVAEFRKSIELHPDFRAYDALASVLHEQGKNAEALDNYRKAMQLAPESPVAVANTAWILATTKDGSMRTGPEALELAQKAYKLSGGSDPFSLRALAAAYAETGNFSAAIETAKRGELCATKQHLPDLAAHIRLEIGSYEMNRPVRE
jgi:tetratricopeptide (TPR) repeat protein